MTRFVVTRLVSFSHFVAGPTLEELFAFVVTQFSPNVKDEPRLRLARLVRKHEA
jgi:hypothetical protein